MSVIDFPIISFSHEEIQLGQGSSEYQFDPFPNGEFSSWGSPALGESDSYLAQLSTSGIAGVSLSYLGDLPPILSHDGFSTYLVYGNWESLTSDMTDVTLLGVDDGSSIDIGIFPSGDGLLSNGVIRSFEFVRGANPVVTPATDAVSPDVAVVMPVADVVSSDVSKDEALTEGDVANSDMNL